MKGYHLQLVPPEQVGGFLEKIAQAKTREQRRALSVELFGEEETARAFDRATEPPCEK